MTTQIHTNSPSLDHTVDEAEILKFENMAEAWWDPTGAFKPLHDLNPVRIAFIRDQILQHFALNSDTVMGNSDKTSGSNAPAPARPFHGLRILDIGCGGGLLCEPMARLGAEIVGVDAALRNIEIAKTHAQNIGLTIDYRHSTAEQLASDGEKFDIVLNMEVVEHVANVDAFIDATAQLVRPDGMMFMATLNRTAKSYALAIVGAEYVMRWLPVGTHDWKKFIRPSELARSLRAAGMRVSSLSGLTYNPLTSVWALNQRDLAVNYMAVATHDN